MTTPKNVKSSKRKKVLTHSKKVLKSLGSVMFIIATSSVPVVAAEPTEIADAVIGAEGGKEVMNAALKVARSKPALSVAATITCLACIPAAGIAASPTMCIACGIMIAKVLG